MKTKMLKPLAIALGLNCSLVPFSFAESDSKKINAAINSAAQYLSQQVLESGQMVYRRRLDDKPFNQQRYNMLRHAGAIYALGQYHRETPAPELTDTIIRSSRWLASCCYQDLPDWSAVAAIWSDSSITGSNKPRQAKLGASGLGLVALLEWQGLDPDSIAINDLRKLARFIVYMQKPDGSFYSKYIPKTGGRDDSWVSLYYPGEAALGLLRLYQLDPNPLWLETANRALLYLSSLRKNQNQVPADHWALIATAELIAHYRSHRLQGDVKSLQQHARRLVEAILNEQVKSSINDKANGGFTEDARTTPTATRLEGLLAARRIVEDAFPELLPNVDAAIHRGIGFLLNAQIDFGPHRGAMPRAVLPLTSRANELRIDYTQHALSAFIEYRKAFLKN